MFIASLFTIAKTWKQPNCPSTDNQIKKMWYIYIYNRILLSDKKKNEILSFAAIWMDLEKIILNVRERQILYSITSMWNLKNNTNEYIYKTETHSQKTNL